MTEKYTPEKVAELVAQARSGNHLATRPSLVFDLADALTAVSAERDMLRGPDTDDRDELITAPIIRALQVAKAERDAAIKEMHARELHHFEEEQARAKAEAERDETLAVIAEVRKLPRYSAFEGDRVWSAVDADDLHVILSRIPEHPKED